MSASNPETEYRRARASLELTAVAYAKKTSRENMEALLRAAKQLGQASDDIKKQRLHKA